MVGIVVATHGPLAKSLIASGELVMGKGKNVQVLGLYHGDNIDEFEDKITDAVIKADEGDGVLILTDLLGGSPCNLSGKVLGAFKNKKNVDCFYGVNLPIYLEVLSSRSFMNLKELTDHIKSVCTSTYGMLSDKLEF